MKLPEIERLSASGRRRVLKWATALLAGPAISPALRVACGELFMGRAWAAENADTIGNAAGAAQTNFIEINMRDQMDWGHVFVAPGMLNPRIQRGQNGGSAAIFFTPDELAQFPNNINLTGDSAALAPHLDTIAMLETCELTTGTTHGHEAANPMRAPGKVMGSKPGYGAMFQRDGATPGQGNEPCHSATPTPASLHNYVQKATTPGLRNGVALKFMGRNKHTVYHYAAGLPGGELDRLRTRDEIAASFPSGELGVPADWNVLGSSQEASALRVALSKLDNRFLAQRRLVKEATQSHAANLTTAEKLLHEGKPPAVSTTLTPEEVAFWSAGVPKQVSGSPKMEIWEQVALAYKLISSGVVRTVALEFCYEDIHGYRPEATMRTMAKQTAIPIARLIEKLKLSRIYDNTIIAAYTLDGGRPPNAGQSGDRGKNAVLLAGGKIRGGYYGDVRMVPDKPTTFSYHAPDLETGLPGPGVLDNSARVPGAAVWRTVMRAAGVPDAVCAKYADAAGAPLSFMLRG